ncbi:hypothetical protein BsWGS_03709 [Bradybaena similaris]
MGGLEGTTSHRTSCKPNPFSSTYRTPCVESTKRNRVAGLSQAAALITASLMDVRLFASSFAIVFSCPKHHKRSVLNSVLVDIYLFSNTMSSIIVLVKSL